MLKSDNCLQRTSLNKICNVPKASMLQSKFLCHMALKSGEDFNGLPYMGIAAILVMWSESLI